MVVQARIDPDNGAQQLQRFSWLIYPFGGILGSLLAGPFNASVNPQYSYFIMGALVLVIFIVSFRLEEGTNGHGRD